MQSISHTSLGKVGLYILLPLAFIVVPTSWIESRRSICLIRTLFGVSCPGCGMTRAISCIFHGHFKRAFQYNKLIVIVFPLLCHAWLQGVTTRLLKMATLDANDQLMQSHYLYRPDRVCAPYGSAQK